MTVLQAPLKVLTLGCLSLVLLSPLLPARLLAATPAMSSAGVPAPAPAAATRAASDEEMASFDAFFVHEYPVQRAGQLAGQRANQRAAPPVFSAVRARHGWDVGATVDLAPTRGYQALCRMSRLHFRYDAAAKKGARWAPDGQPAQFAWLDGAAGCPLPPHPVRLLQHVPDRDIVPLLRQAPALLQRARLLLAGSTDCAELRSYRFELDAIEIGAPAAGMEELHGLVFQSDHQRSAHVWVRPGAGELVAWNVSCPAQ